MDRAELEELDRESLVVRAQAAGIRRARILTRPELIDELLRLDPNADEAQLRKSRGFFGRARDLVARVVERGLHLPDAADRIRELAGTGLTLNVPRTEPQAMPTVTLAEIYAAQGHKQRAVETLRRVLEREPEHAAARALLARLEDAGYVAPPPPLPPEPENEPEPLAEDDDASAPDSPAPVSEDAPPRSGRLGEGALASILTAPRDDVVFAIRGPSYDDANGEAEFSLAPASEPPPAGGADELEETYTFVAPSADLDVDPNAETGVFDAIADGAFEAEVEASRADLDSGEVTPRFAAASSQAEPEEPDEIDECVAIPLPRGEGGGRMYARWSVSFAAIGRLLGARPRGRFVVRAHVVTPGWDGPNAETRDLAVSPDAGEAILQALPDPSVVRVAVGWLDGSTFVPLAHSPSIDVGPRRALFLWTPKGTVPVRLDHPRAAAIKRAWSEAQRVARTSVGNA